MKKQGQDPLPFYSQFLPQFISENADLAYALIPVARKLYLNEDFGVELE